jgi:hypothetical protein
MQKAQKRSDDEKYAREKSGKRYLARAGKRRADPHRLSTAASFVATVTMAAAPAKVKQWQTAGAPCPSDTAQKTKS